MFERFKDLCDKKKIVSDPDIEAIINDEVYQPQELWRLLHVQVSTGSGLRPTATVRLRGPDGMVREDASIGTGPVDSVYKAINRIVQVPNVLTEFSIKAVTEGIDAVGEVTIRIEPTAAVGGSLNGNGEGYLTQTGACDAHLQRPRRGHRHHLSQRQGLHQRAQQDADGNEGERG